VGPKITTGPESASLPASSAPLDEPDDDPDDPPLDEPLDDPLDEPLDDPLDEPLDDPLDEPLDEPLDDPEDDPELPPLLDAESTPESGSWLGAPESEEPFDPPLRPLVPTRSEHALTETSAQTRLAVLAAGTLTRRR
jgi:hypothetical protein